MSATASTSLEDRLALAVEQARQLVMDCWLDNKNLRTLERALARYGDGRALQGRWEQAGHTFTDADRRAHPKPNLRHVECVCRDCSAARALLKELHAEIERWIQEVRG